MYQNDDGKVEGIVGIQVYDTICAGAPTFIDKENRTSKELPSKEKQILTRKDQGSMAWGYPKKETNLQS